MKHSRAIIGSVIGLLACALIAPATYAATSDANRVVQIGTYDALVAPNYDGVAPINSVWHGQTLGLGTFDHLDGELVLVGGTMYRVSTDGKPQKIDGTQSTPFFEAITFAADTSGPVAPGTTCANLINTVNTLAHTSNGVIAVRVRGTFSDLVTRSVPAQAKPYLPLSEVVAKQTLFPLGSRKAVLVGFRTGLDFAGVGAPGLHLHGVTADRTAGGHVISCVAGPDVQLSIQRAAGVNIS
jgi:acetolactate decarboxylase